MNMMNGWVAVTHPTMENLRPDSAIRQFCAARAEEQEQEQGGDQWGPISPHDELQEIWSSLDFTNDTPQLELDQLVDTFFNAEYYDKDASDHLQHHDDDVSMIDGVYYEPNASTIQGGGDRDEDPAFLEPSSAGVEEAAAVNANGLDEGLQLVHLLLACAEAVGCRDAHLAHSILAQIWPCVNPWGDSLQRVSQCFAMGLKSRLSLLQNVNPNGSFSSNLDASTITREEKSEAFALLHKTTPYIAFGFVAANDAICQAAKGKESLHIIDLGMEHNLQWPSMVKTLSIRPEGPPKSVRITGVIGNYDAAELEDSMRRLRNEAAALGVSLEYNFVREHVSPLTLTREKLELKEGEAVFVNSIMQLHKHVKESRGSLKTILQSIKKLSPNVLTVVEQDANHNGPFFLGRFLESLHYYSAIFDSLDSSLARGSRERMKVERWHLAEEIRNVVACEGDERVERHERADQWRRQLGRAGFQVVGLKCLDEAKVVVGGYGCDGYTVASEKGCLQLGWKGRPIMLASAWQLNNLPSSCSKF